MTKKQILNTKFRPGFFFQIEMPTHLVFSHQPIQWKFIICDSSDDPIRLQKKFNIELLIFRSQLLFTFFNSNLSIFFFPFQALEDEKMHQWNQMNQNRNHSRKFKFEVWSLWIRWITQSKKKIRLQKDFLPQFVEDQSVNCLGEEELEGSNLHSSPVSLARSTYFCKIIEKKNYRENFIIRNCHLLSCSQMYKQIRWITNTT
jgi:hypothetical protein